MKEIIQLNDCPELLQAAVNKYLNNSDNVELLAVQKFTQTPYTDKTITRTTYRTITLQWNYFCVFKMTLCSKEEWSDQEVSRSGMLAGEISDIVELSPLWFK